MYMATTDSMKKFDSILIPWLFVVVVVDNLVHVHLQ